MKKVISLIDNEIEVLKRSAAPSMMDAMEPSKTETIFELERYGAQKQIQVLTRLRNNIEIVMLSDEQEAPHLDLTLESEASDVEAH